MKLLRFSPLILVLLLVMTETRPAYAQATCPDGTPGDDVLAIIQSSRIHQTNHHNHDTSNQPGVAQGVRCQFVEYGHDTQTKEYNA